MKKIFIIGVVAMIFTACRPNIHVNQNPSAGPTADFSNYLAIGNSLTAGYTDGSLTVSGQLNSYPKRLFEQFQLLPQRGAVGPFIQPLVSGDWGYPGPKYVLGMTYNPCIPSDSGLAPIINPGTSDSVNGDYRFLSGINNNQINNVGVPGIRAVDYKVAGYAQFAKVNKAPFAFRFYNDVNGSPNDELAHVVGNLHPTFFTMWLGANDVLGYALAGGQGNGIGTATPVLLPYFYNSIDISPLIAFDSCYDLALNTAISTGASGALINIPDITSIPFFTTVPANGLTLARQGQADTLTAIYASHGITASFNVGANYFMIQDNAGLTRQAVPGELILMTVPDSNLTCHGWGSANAASVPMPIPNNYVLTTDEIQNIKTATANFNAYIQYEASIHHLAYVDMNSYFKTLASGITFDGIHYTPAFVTGGAFSLDGVHPTQRGYALIANQIISTINAFYKSNVPSIDVNQYKGVVFP